MAYMDHILASDEHILRTARRHPLFILGRAALWIIGALILIGVGIWLGISVNIWLGLAVGLLAMVPVAIATVRVLSWMNERYIVTNFRIIQIEGLLNRRVLDSSLGKVNDLLLTQSLMGRFLNYGTLQIITGSDLGVNQLDALKEPYEFKRVIVDARNDFGDDDDDPGRYTDDLTRLLVALNDLRDSGVMSQAEYEAKRTELLGSKTT